MRAGEGKAVIAQAAVSAARSSARLQPIGAFADGGRYLWPMTSTYSQRPSAWAAAVRAVVLAARTAVQVDDPRAAAGAPVAGGLADVQLVQARPCRRAAAR